MSARSDEVMDNEVASGNGAALPTGLRRGRQPKTRRGERTKQAIKDAARDAFCVDGYSGARITDIAERAGVAFGTFYTYFDTKDDVLAELLDEVFEDMYAKSRAPWLREPPYEAIQRAIAGYMSSYRDHADMLRVMREALSVDPDFADYWFWWRARFLARIVRNIRASQDDGVTPPQLDAVLMASALGGMLDDFCWIWMSMGGDQPRGEPFRDTLELDDAVEVVSSLWYRALFSSEGGDVGQPGATVGGQVQLVRRTTD